MGGIIPVRLQQFPCCLCAEAHPPKRTLGISVPALVVPIKTKHSATGYWPAPVYLRFRGALCHAHTASFNINAFTDYFGSWYDMIGDQLRANRKMAVNPYPDDPDFRWQEYVIDPDWSPAPREECYVQFWSPETLAAKGAHYKLGGNKQ